LEFLSERNILGAKDNIGGGSINVSIILIYFDLF
jgi:hypothetical protein